MKKYEGLIYEWLSNQKGAKIFFRFYPDDRLQIEHLQAAEKF